MKLNLSLTAHQKRFCDAEQDEVLYGGAAGGGKSYAILTDSLLYALRYPGIRQLILRRTFPELRRSLIATSLTMFPRGVASYNDTKHIWSFSNGSVVEFGYLDSAADVTKYQSAEYDVIRFDELTHFTDFQYTYMQSRVRGVNGYPKQIKSATNPGGIGHAWVKERFVDAAPPGKELVLPDGRRRLFLPARVTDNTFLMKADPDYVKRLSQLPTMEKKALLYGDWNVFAGQVFTEWRDDPTHYEDRRFTHVITPFSVPKSWRRYRSFDFGYKKPFSVLWWAVDFDGCVYLYRELYGCTDEPNTGVRLTPQEIAKRILELESFDGKIYGVADPSIWDASRGESVAEMMEQEGVYFTPGDNARIAGKMQFHYRLSFDEEGIPGMYVFSSCRHFIRTFPALLYDKNRVEDVDSSLEDHAYDAGRYFLMEHPVAPKRAAQRTGYYL